MSFFVLIFVFVVALVLLGLFAVARKQHARVGALEDLAGQTSPIDIEALQNLIAPEQTKYLRGQLSKRDFRRVHRQRLLATTDYVRRIAVNSAILMQLATAARHSQDAAVAEAAQVMAERALRVRMLAMLALIKLYAQSVTPGWEWSSESVLAGYHQLTESAILLTRLQRPAFAGKMTAML